MFRRFRVQVCVALLSITVSGCDPRRAAPTPDISSSTTKSAPSEDRSAASAARDQKLQLSDQELDDGWVSLFDGETLFGWQPGTNANWRVEDGAITVDEGEAGLLCTTSPFADYELSLEFRAPAQTNSGVFLRTSLRPERDEIKTRSYELNIAPPDNPFPTGSLVTREKVVPRVEADAWHRFDVTVDQDQVAVRLDGDVVLEYQDPQPAARGLIGLQLNQGEVAFRAIKVKPLRLAAMFNGRDLSGWKTYPNQATEFTVSSEGWLHAKNLRDGRGQLETEATYADFAMQLECLTHAPELNSGVFFRCIPGQEMNGYESQIHNGITSGDRTKPKDCGTGGIFRRVDARRVVADDQRWFHKTIIAAGPHIAVWVEGYQVTDWQDERPAHENPRQGLRVEAGTIQLQGHDATTDLSFRNLRIRELPNQPDH